MDRSANEDATRAEPGHLKQPARHELSHIDCGSTARYPTGMASRR
jgi:hypothetical protein